MPGRHALQEREHGLRPRRFQPARPRRRSRLDDLVVRMVIHSLPFKFFWIFILQRRLGTIAAGAMWRGLKMLIGSDSASPSSGATGLDRRWWLHASVPGG